MENTYRLKTLLEKATDAEMIKANYLKPFRQLKEQNTQSNQEEHKQDQKPNGHTPMLAKLTINQTKLQRALNVRNIKGENGKTIDKNKQHNSRFWKKHKTKFIHFDQTILKELKKANVLASSIGNRALRQQYINTDLYTTDDSSTEETK